MPEYLLHKRLVCDAGTFAAGEVADLDQKIGDRLVANGWAEPADEADSTEEPETPDGKSTTATARKTPAKTASKTAAKPDADPKDA